MAQSGYTPLSLYYSTTGSAVPSSSNLVNGELAINITDGKLYYKDNTGTVQLIASKNNAGMVYPGAGIPNSTGTAWGTSYSTTGSGTVVALATTPTFTTNITTPLTIGGTTASSTLTLQSTSGTGTTDAILFNTGSQVERLRINTSGAIGLNGANYGTAGQVLTSAGSGATPTWSNPSTGGTSIGLVRAVSINCILP